MNRPDDQQQESRQWPDDDWAAAVAALQARAAGSMAMARSRQTGRAARDDIEDRTDALAWPPYAALGQGGAERLLAALTPIAIAILDSGAVPLPNPVGLPDLRDGTPR